MWQQRHSLSVCIWFQDWRQFAPWVNCPCAPTPPPYTLWLILDFHAKWPLNFLVSTIRQVIWPSPGTLVGNCLGQSPGSWVIKLGFQNQKKERKKESVCACARHGASVCVCVCANHIAWINLIWYNRMLEVSWSFRAGKLHLCLHHSSDRPGPLATI